jgi:hypothetical protein
MTNRSTCGAETIVEKSARLAGISGTWSSFPWIYRYPTLHKKANEANNQYFHKYINGREYASKLRALLEHSEVTLHEYTMSLHVVYCNGDISSNEYLMMREPNR